jgi:hypothetical protein
MDQGEDLDSIRWIYADRKPTLDRRSDLGSADTAQRREMVDAVQRPVAIGLPTQANPKQPSTIDNYVTLAVFTISLDNRDHLRGFQFSFFDRGCVPVRIVASV